MVEQKQIQKKIISPLIFVILLRFITKDILCSFERAFEFTHWGGRGEGRGVKH